MFNQAEKEFIPKKVVKTGKRKFSNPIDKKTLSKRKKKYRLWKRYLESRDAKVYEEYCRCRNQVRRLTRQGIKVYVYSRCVQFFFLDLCILQTRIK